MKIFAPRLRRGVVGGWVLWSELVRGDTNLPPVLSTPLPDAGLSVLRVIGALILVLAVFLIGVWIVKRWQLLGLPAGRLHRLKVLEIRSLGARQALYVVGYEQQRFLVASSPSGVTLLTNLPAASDEPLPLSSSPPSFAESLRQIWDRKS